MGARIFVNDGDSLFSCNKKQCASAILSGWRKHVQFWKLRSCRGVNIPLVFWFSYHMGRKEQGKCVKGQKSFHFVWHNHNHDIKFLLASCSKKTGRIMSWNEVTVINEFKSTRASENRIQEQHLKFRSQQSTNCHRKSITEVIIYLSSSGGISCNLWTGYRIYKKTRRKNKQRNRW